MNKKGFTPHQISDMSRQSRARDKGNPANQRFGAGFTLIELLVVIAVIGMLASIVLVSLGPARQKARDGRRVQEVQQMVTALEIEAADGGEAVQTCTNADHDASACNGPGVINFANFKDPSTPGTPCTSASTGTCQYSISQDDGAAGAQTNDYQLCFFVEQPVGSISGLGTDAGLKSVGRAGENAAPVWRDNCN